LAMEQRITKVTGLVCGLDVSDRWTQVCVLSGADGEVEEESRVRTSREGVRRRFSGIPAMRVALEVGTHSAWISELLEGLGHEVVVANPRQVRLIGKNRRKDDRLDAERLARLARVDSRLLAPVEHRRGEARADLALLKARDALVRTRTLLINHTRGVIKSTGSRLPSCGTTVFAKRVKEFVPPALEEVLLPILETIEELTRKIRSYDRRAQQRIAHSYPAAAHHQAIAGVGPITALAYSLVIFRPERFPKSRSVGSYLGLVPARRESGERQPHLGISKEGSEFLRRLLVQAAHYILGPFGPDCDLRRFGVAIVARGGPYAKHRALVAVARKLATVMHRIWITGEDYDPFYNSRSSRVA